MVGRALGSLVLIRVRAERLLSLAAIVALLLCLIVTQAGGLTPGNIAAWAALAIGFFNSVMFPTIFTLTLERSTAPTAATSGLLCMAIVGGAIVPVIMGVAADSFGLALAFFVPLVGYACVAAFALVRPARPPSPPPTSSPKRPRKFTCARASSFMRCRQRPSPRTPKITPPK